MWLCMLSRVVRLDRLLATDEEHTLLEVSKAYFGVTFASIIGSLKEMPLSYSYIPCALY